MKNLIKSIIFSTVSSSEFKVVLTGVKVLFSSCFEFFSYNIDNSFREKTGLKTEGEKNQTDMDVKLSEKFNTTLDNLVIVIMGWSSDWKNIYLDDSNNITMIGDVSVHDL
jgi:hypothetical protein